MWPRQAGRSRRSAGAPYCPPGPGVGAIRHIDPACVVANFKLLMEGM